MKLVRYEKIFKFKDETKVRCEEKSSKPQERNSESNVLYLANEIVEPCYKVVYW